MSRSKLFILGICMDSCDLLYVLNPFEQVWHACAVAAASCSSWASAWTAVTCSMCSTLLNRYDAHAQLPQQAVHPGHLILHGQMWQYVLNPFEQVWRACAADAICFKCFTLFNKIAPAPLPLWFKWRAVAEWKICKYFDGGMESWTQMLSAFNVSGSAINTFNRHTGEQIFL